MLILINTYNHMFGQKVVIDIIYKRAWKYKFFNDR